jgi:putative DNA-invertase from lambdoid prophage Rac
MSQAVVRVGLYARVSTHDQQTLALQREAMQSYANVRGWIIVRDVAEVASGATVRPQREELLRAARRRDLDMVLVWRLDRWGRSLPDLIDSLQELTALSVGFVSLTEALDLTTPAGRAMAAMLAVFAEFEREVLRERVRAGIAQARKEGKAHGRPRTASLQVDSVRRLHAQGISKAEIARRLGIGRASVQRILHS